MDIRSAFNSGLTGFQSASNQVSEASSRIAHAGSVEIAGNNSDLTGKVTSSAQREPISITTELVNLKVAEFQAKSSAKVITTADDMLGTLINTRV